MSWAGPVFWRGSALLRLRIAARLVLGLFAGASALLAKGVCMLMLSVDGFMPGQTSVANFYNTRRDTSI